MDINFRKIQHKLQIWMSSFRRNKKRYKNITIIVILAIFCISSGILVGTIYGYINTTTPIPDTQIKAIKLTTKVYDAAAIEITQLKSEQNREWVKLDNIPLVLQNAFIAIEDRRFREHAGVDYVGFVRAIFNKVINPNGKTEGASTLTMQVVKNLTGEKEVTLSRKIQEQTRAIQLEKVMKKEDILVLYLNLIYLGDGKYGIKTAAKRYFGKDDLKSLTIAECASLASITQTPETYAPVSDTSRKNNMEKQKTVLKYMYEEKFISEDEYNTALSEKVAFIAETAATKNASSNQSYFVDNVINEIVTDFKKKGWNEATIKENLYNGGWKIYTTLDTKVQLALDAVYKDPKYFPFDGKNCVNKKDGKYAIQSGMVIINPALGEIVGLYGGNGIKTADMAFNHATQLNRNPGSSFKPLAVYGPGIDMGTITPDTIIDDSVCYLDLKHPHTPYPKNYNDKHYGYMTINEGLKTSNNVVAAKTWNMLDKKAVFEYLKKDGIESKFSDGVSVALGGTIGVSPLKMAAAYVPFINKGIYTDPISYTKIIDRDGNILIDKKNAPTTKQKNALVYKEETCKIMIKMMGDVCKSGGTASYVLVKNKQGQQINVAGKTGTTDDDIDRWFLGFTPNYVGAVWFGDKNNKPLPAFDQNPAVLIWNAVMNKVHANIKPIDFPKTDYFDRFHFDPGFFNNGFDWKRIFPNGVDFNNFDWNQFNPNNINPNTPDPNANPNVAPSPDPNVRR